MVSAMGNRSGAFLHSHPMLRSLAEAWSRHAVGFRQGELDDGDAVATMVVTLIGGPAFLVGALMVTVDGLTVAQILLVAPLAALGGGTLVAVSASMAAQTGANASWLLRPSFGRWGSILVSLIRLGMVVAWGAIGLQLAGEMTVNAAEAAGLTFVDGTIAVVLISVLGLLLIAMGLSGAIKVAFRRPLFFGSVVLVMLLAWRLAAAGGGFAGGGDGSFWKALQRGVELAAVFIPFVQTVARRLHDEDDAMTSFGVGYAVPATVMLAAGSILAVRLEGLPTDLTGIEVGTAAFALAFAWVLIAEIDQAFSAFVAAGSEAVGIVTVGATWMVGLVIVAGVIGLALAGPTLPVDWANLLTSIAFPAALIAAADFYLARDHYYTEADIYGGTEGVVNLPGVSCWLAAVALGQLLDANGPEQWTSLFGRVDLAADLPWRLIIGVVLAGVYVLVVRWRDLRTSSVYELRGV